MDLLETLAAPLHAAALYAGLIVLLMAVLKMYVGAQRGKHKVAPGDVSNPNFERALRVQQNAVEDVPVLLTGIIVLALLDAPVWLIHGAGATLVVSRILHAQGLASSAGFSFGRSAGTLGTILVYLAVTFGLLQRAFDAGA